MRVLKKLCIMYTYKYLASGMSQLDVGRYFRVGVSTTSGIIPEVCSALWEKLAPPEMPVPDTKKWIDIAEEFEERWNYHHCLGKIGHK